MANLLPWKNGRITAMGVIKKEKISMRESQGFGYNLPESYHNGENFWRHTFCDRLKTTQNWAGLEQDDINNNMIDTTYELPNTEIEYKNDKLGYGIFFLMMVLEPDSELDCEIHIVSPALRFT